jgi:uncharacterized OB-fold protein
MDEVTIDRDDDSFEYDLDEFYTYWYKCPKCGQKYVAIRFKFCPDCGVKINWIGNFGGYA